MLTCGSVFSGGGLLDAGLHLAGLRHAWMCESDPWRRELLRTRFGVPVHDDIRTLRGQAAADAGGSGARRATQESFGGRTDGGGPARSTDGRKALSGSGGCGVPRVDLIAGGFPCKGASSAGNGTGLEHAETALWSEMRRVVGELRPRYVLIENVANILGMAAAPGEPAGSLWGTVLGDLAALRFDVRWDCVPAAAIGAPHLRDRVFAVATQSARADERWDGGQRRIANGWTDAARGGDSAAADTDRTRLEGSGRQRQPSQRRTKISSAGDAPYGGVAVDWGEYEPAIQRWEAVHGAAPEPLVRRLDDGNPKLSRVRARVDRSRLSALGDGVHVYCGWLVGLAIMRHAQTGEWS